jgi:hypothetical protein
MVCQVCGWERFASAEYRSPAGRARALECERCHTIVLTEAAARTHAELDAIRSAMAVRDAIRRKDRSSVSAERRVGPHPLPANPALDRRR